VRTLATKGLRASWSADLGLAPVREAVVEVARRAAMTLVAVSGLVTGQPPQLTDLGLDEWAVLAAVDLWTRVAGLPWGARKDELTPYVRLALEQTSELTVREIGAMARRAADLRSQVEAAFRQTDVVLTPATAVVAFSATAAFLPVVAGRDASATGPAPFSVLANLCGCPAVSVPAGRDHDGLPVGLQLVGPPGADALLLRLAALLEGARPWPRTSPLRAGVGREPRASPSGTIPASIAERSGS
jgi:Asp-tRNA(Asn)/Glu-tRNA(Gln) amidotransferase A subunit family amidase